MELVEGGDLVAWLGERPRGAAEILAAFAEAGRGLVAAHAKGLVHRDFKPSNVLIGDGRVRVTDFGLAQLDPTTRGRLDPGDPRRGLVETRPSAGGTPGFVAPEVERGREPDARADQFAFCVSLLWALTGELRGEAGDREARLARRGVPARARRALLRGLAEAPDARFPAMEALLAELHGDRSRRSLWVAGGLLGLALAVGAALGLAGGRERGDPLRRGERGPGERLGVRAGGGARRQARHQHRPGGPRRLGRGLAERPPRALRRAGRLAARWRAAPLPRRRAR